MNADFDNELLSALIDGELSPAEADAVRQQVAESEILAAELAALEKLSGVVRDVPPVAAPTSLQSNVMNLLQSGPGPVVSPSTQPAPRSKGGWSGVAGGLVAAIALCIVVVVSNSGTDDPARVADRAPSRSQSPVEMVDAGVAAEQIGADMGAVAPPSARLADDHSLEMVVDTGLIQQEAEWVRVKLDPDELRRKLVSAQLSPRESNDAPAGYQAFVVEGSRSEINRVLRDFQRATGDLSIEIDRTSVPKPILDEFQMEAALIALKDRGPVGDAESAGSKMIVRSAAPPAPSAGSGFSGGSRARTATSPARQARAASKMPGIQESEQESRIAVTERGSSADKSNDATVVAKKTPQRIEATKVLFFYKLPADSPASKEPCAGA